MRLYYKNPLCRIILYHMVLDGSRPRPMWYDELNIGHEQALANLRRWVADDSNIYALLLLIIGFKNAHLGAQFVCQRLVYFSLARRRRVFPEAVMAVAVIIPPGVVNYRV